MNFQLLAVIFIALQLCYGEPNGVIVFEDEEVPSARLKEIGDRAGTGAAIGFVDYENLEDFPTPPPGEGGNDNTRASGAVDYENLKRRISWGWELKGKGASTHLQLPANRLPAKFKPNQKYYLGFGNPDLKYPGCPGTVQCRFLEHCENSRRFFDSFTTFAANACPIGDQFIGVCCSGDTSVPIATTTKKPITTTTKPRPSQSTILPSKPSSRPANSSSYKCGDVLRFDEKVVGGTPADKDEWPWMAAILYTDGNQQFCGGALITNRHVLTAAHCVDGNSPGDMFVRLGEYDLNQRDFTEKDLRVSRIKMHEQYKKSPRGSPVDDIALLTLSEPVSFSKSILNICLPDKNMVVEEQNAYVTGWGTTCSVCESSNILLQLFLPVWKQSDCLTTYARKGVPIPSTQICAGFRDGKKDSCQGDSGGPLMMKNSKGKWTVVGVVSFGIGCAKANSPGVYTKVSSYIDWIQRNARE